MRLCEKTVMSAGTGSGRAVAVRLGIPAPFDAVGGADPKAQADPRQGGIVFDGDPEFEGAAEIDGIGRRVAGFSGRDVDPVARRR